MFHRKFATSLLLLMLVFAPAVHAQSTPDELVANATTEILTLLKEKKAFYEADKKNLYQMVDEKILPYFDFRKMSQWVLGIHWRQATDAQRDEFTEQFRQLLVRTYATALLKYNDQEIIMLPFTGKADDKIVIVKTEVKQKSGEPNIALYYTFYNLNPGWKAFDLTIEGVSLVANYRKVYASRLQKESLDSLIKYLSDLNSKSGDAVKSGA
ncbi:MAG: ABC transporter substrate-binding protein [Acidiferrobacterales bacterium]|jgi:phospholipid transport system substrate-binding protein|nr:ABC transporter substrate-binding protein [Acidiferrobacterales bacterium]